MRRPVAGLRRDVGFWVCTAILAAPTGLDAQRLAPDSVPIAPIVSPPALELDRAAALLRRSLLPAGSLTDLAGPPSAPIALSGEPEIVLPPLREARIRRGATGQSPQARGRVSWWAPVVSAIVPGAGQTMLGQDRGIAYFAVEGYAWLRYASDIREARQQRNSYRRLAADVARAYFAPNLQSGDFEYYERMETFVESGVFDMFPGDVVEPETDTETFNGTLWLRARSTFWEDPATPPPPTSDAYRSALDYYVARAIQPAFRWSWRDAQLEQDLFRRTITRSNDAFRRSIQDLGVVIANHALSTVDAYVSVRLRRIDVASNAVGVMATIPWSPGAPGQGSADRR